MSIEPATPLDRNARRLPARRSLFGACAIEGCHQPQHPALPLCDEHAWAVWAEMGARQGNLQEEAKAEEERRQWEELRVQEIRERMASSNVPTDPGTIYYLQVEDQIKIGYTTNLNTRLAAYPPMARLLATHPGTKATEAFMHERFANLLSGRKEWFKASDEITAHINTVHKQFKQDRRVTA